jgi:hypothetical protein
MVKEAVFDFHLVAACGQRRVRYTPRVGLKVEF